MLAGLFRMKCWFLQQNNYFAGINLKDLMNYTTASVTSRKSFAQNLLLKAFLTIFFICWITTFLHTPDRANWYTENTLTIIFLVGLAVSYRKFKFSDLSYTLIFVYMLLHIYGAEYTYAENPLGYWLKDVFGMGRNHYDRIVHFSFGLLLAYPLRDYFKNWFGWPAWVCWVLPVEITMSFSGLYEIIEWLVADVFFPSEGTAYLGTQGDVWDAQKDMGLAFSGAVISMLFSFMMRKFFRTTE
jgi:putative membrane protein